VSCAHVRDGDCFVCLSRSAASCVSAQQIASERAVNIGQQAAETKGVLGAGKRLMSDAEFAEAKDGLRAQMAKHSWIAVSSNLLNRLLCLGAYCHAPDRDVPGHVCVALTPVEPAP